MRNKLALLTGLSALILASAAPGICRADTVLFSNYAPSFGYVLNGGDTVGNDLEGANWGAGDAFVSSATAQLSSIYVTPTCEIGCRDPLIINLTANAGGKPGAVIESFSVPASVLGAFGVFNSPLMLNSVLHPTLTAGTEYWVTLTTDLNNTLVWNWNSIGQVSSEAASTDGGLTWTAPSGLATGALQVNGAATTSAVPEPASIALLVTGLAMLAGSRLRLLSGATGR
jgi:hypothetical protein